jgi:hypothetical protein
LCPKQPPASLLDLPNELIYAIMEGAPFQTLLACTSVCSRLRILSSATYLRALEILTVDEDCCTIKLRGHVPPIAVLLLFSASLPPKVALTCDLYFLMQFEEDLCRLCSNNWTVTALSVILPDTETHLLRHSRLPYTLQNIFISISHTRTCTSIAFSLDRYSLVHPRYPDLPTKRGLQRLCDERTIPLMDTVCRLSINTIMMESEGLWRVMRRLLVAPLVDQFRLELYWKSNTPKIFSEISLPTLQFLTIQSPFVIDPPISFLRNHLGLRTISLFTSMAPSAVRRPRAQAEQLSKNPITFSSLALFYYNPNYSSWLSAISPDSSPISFAIIPTFWIPGDRQQEFCNVVRDTCYGLHEFSKIRAVDDLRIRLPSYLHEHLCSFHSDGSPCATPDVLLPNVRNLVLDFGPTSRITTIVS